MKNFLELNFRLFSGVTLGEKLFVSFSTNAQHEEAQEFFLVLHQ